MGWGEGGRSGNLGDLQQVPGHLDREPRREDGVLYPHLGTSFLDEAARTD